MRKRFSSRQIVLMVVAVCAAAILGPFAVPVAVGAATGSLVNITDPISRSQKARVSAGALQVSAPPVMPKTPLDTINDLTLHSGDTRRPAFAGVGFRKLTFTSLIASAEGSTAGSVELLVIAYVKSDSTSGDCETLSGFGAAERFTVMVPVGQTVNINWPTGLPWTQYADANDYYCINVESFGGPTGYTAHFSLYGYRNP